METNFKVGDRVYDIVWGWGVVTSDLGINNIEIKFDSNIYQSFRKDGRYADGSPTLSFTEYTLQGFSQDRMLKLPNYGELCLVRDSYNENWKCVKFKLYNNKSSYPFTDLDNDDWKQMKRIEILD
jgi:hypothetical protein